MNIFNISLPDSSNNHRDESHKNCDTTASSCDLSILDAIFTFSFCFAHFVIIRIGCLFFTLSVKRLHILKSRWVWQQQGEYTEQTTIQRRCWALYLCAVFKIKNTTLTLRYITCSICTHLARRSCDSCIDEIRVLRKENTIIWSNVTFSWGRAALPLETRTSIAKFLD